MSDCDRSMDVIGLMTGEGGCGFALFCSVEALLDRLERNGMEDMP